MSYVKSPPLVNPSYHSAHSTPCNFFSAGDVNFFMILHQHCLWKHDHQWWIFIYDTLPDQQLHIASANMTAWDVKNFMILCQTNNDTSPLQTWLLGIQFIWYSARPMTASNVIFFYDTLPDQWLHIASASMIIGDVIFFMILRQTNDCTCLCKLYDTPPDQWWHITSTNMTAGDVNFLIILRWTNNDTLPLQTWPAGM